MSDFEIDVEGDDEQGFSYSTGGMFGDETKEAARACCAKPWVKVVRKVLLWSIAFVGLIMAIVAVVEVRELSAETAAGNAALASAFGGAAFAGHLETVTQNFTQQLLRQALFSGPTSEEIAKVEASAAADPGTGESLEDDFADATDGTGKRRLFAGNRDAELFVAQRSKLGYVIYDFCGDLSDAVYEHMGKDHEGRSFKVPGCGEHPNLNSYVLDRFITRSDGTQLVVVRDVPNKIVYVVFRGTEPTRKEDIITDIDFVPGKYYDFVKDRELWLHPGFADALKSVYAEALLYTKAYSDQGWRVVSTGHSLGGAIATLFSLRMRANGIVPQDRIATVTFGQPMVGNKEVTDELNKFIGSSKAGDDIFYTRVVANNDLVVAQPAMYATMLVDSGCSVSNFFKEFWDSVWGWFGYENESSYCQDYADKFGSYAHGGRVLHMYDVELQTKTYEVRVCGSWWWSSCSTEIKTETKAVDVDATMVGDLPERLAEKGWEGWSDFGITDHLMPTYFSLMSQIMHMCPGGERDDILQWQR
jgi:hypothetical protein